MTQQPDITIRWNGRDIPARTGESVAAALWRAGITTIARSRKLHRPLGYSGAYLTGVLARVDGRPNVRLDLEPARAGLKVEMQNTWPSPGFDLLKFAQLLPAKAVYGGFEHGAMMPSSGLGYRVAERIMANLAGVARPADADLHPQEIPGRGVEVDCLVVGGGPAGIAEANARVEAGQGVALVTRGHNPARFARSMGIDTPALDPRVQLFAGMELFGCYRGGAIMVGAPHDHRSGAVAFWPKSAVLATGRRSMPPLVKGNQLPGVLDAHAALELLHTHGVAPGARIAVVGTGAETALATRLKALGANVVHVGRAADLKQIKGRKHVTGILAATEVACDTLVHAGPWRSDPSLSFQVSAEGLYQVMAQPLPQGVTLAGAAAEGNEPIPASRHLHRDTLICPCMDVTAGELYCHVDEGETDPEVLKRLTSCGMGTCQGFPCWESMLATLAARVDALPDDFARPTHRPPRRAITIAQAAGLVAIVEPDK
ncbi:MAG TPA: 2Fe-2S iron-sulfur cluster-binding protein [Mycoplana sp.]|nr:2Fe-2S iron-sulfur cluster-binding protein [Mycoplana sp.]